MIRRTFLKILGAVVAGVGLVDRAPKPCCEGGITNYLEDRIIKDTLTGEPYIPTIYVGLSTANPLADASDLAEPIGNEYARVNTTGGWDVFPEDSDIVVANARAVVFPRATGNWGKITHFALFDAATHGNMLAYGPMNAPVSVHDFVCGFAAKELRMELETMA